MRHVLLTVAILALATPVHAQDATRKLTNVAGDVYLFRNNFHNSLVVATSAGTVRVDPINAEASQWLADNLGTIDAPPVSHLIYSHSHLDHASGGAVHEGATVITHENAPDQIDGVAPEVRVGANHTLEVGGKTFELTALGPGHGEDMLAVIVRPENVAFIVDVAAPRRLPFRDLGGANMDDWIGQIETAQGLDFEIFAPGHGAVGTPADLDDAGTYMGDLRAGVLEGLQAGKSVDAIKADLTLDAYADWQQYADWRALNIEGMARYLQDTGQVN